MWAGCTYFILLWLRIMCSVKLCKLWQYLFNPHTSPCWWLNRSSPILVLLHGTRKILSLGDGFCLCRSGTAAAHVNAPNQIKSITILSYTIAFKILTVTYVQSDFMFKPSTVCPKSVFLGLLLYISELTAIISLYSINWLVFNIKELPTRCSIYLAVYISL
jgi:hypothetical protein